MSYLLDQLSREIGRDAREEANRRHPELRECTQEHVAKIIEAVDYVMDFHRMPKTVENAERAYTMLESNGELGKLAGQYAPQPTPAGFKPRADEDEWMQTAPIEEVGRYLTAKYPKG